MISWSVVRLVAFATLGLFLGIVPATAQVALVSINAAGTDTGNDDSGLASSSDVQLVSADGRFIAFDSRAGDLGPTDTNGVSDAYVRDLQSGTTTLVSINVDGDNAANGESRPKAISPDGRFVLFTSEASDLVTLAKNNGTDTDLYLRDLKFDTTELVSVNSAGTGTGTRSVVGIGGMTPDGRYVSFTSGSDQLVPVGDANDRNDAFVRDLKTGTTTLVSADENGATVALANSSAGDITPDGRYVLFISQASTDDLISVPDANLGLDVFVCDLSLGTTTLVSVNTSGTASGDDSSNIGDISDDGSLVAFISGASDLVPGGVDGNGAEDVFVRNLTTETTTVLSVNTGGNTATGDSSLSPGSISGTRFVVFHSSAFDITPANVDMNADSDVFMHDLALGTNTLVSVEPSGLAGNGRSRRQVMSEDGRLVVFESDATDLHTDLQPAINDSNTATDVFVRDLQLGTTRLLSTDGAVVGNDDAERPRISPDGGTIVFQSDANNLVITDTNTGTDVFAATIQPATIDHDLGVAGGGFRTRGRVRLSARRCDAGECIEQVAIKIKNFGDHDEAEVPFEVSVVSGPAPALGGFCTGDAGPLFAGETVTVADVIGACEITYTVAGEVELLLTVMHPGSADQDLDNNTASASVNVVP